MNAKVRGWHSVARLARAIAVERFAAGGACRGTRRRGPAIAGLSFLLTLSCASETRPSTDLDAALVDAAADVSLVDTVADATLDDTVADAALDVPNTDAPVPSCAVDEQCSSSELGLRRICDPETHRCAYCAPSRAETCGAAEFCADGRCLPGCARDQACAATPATPRCNTASHRCVACVVDDDCGLYAGARAACTDGVCGFRCLAGRGDCDGVAANGCEVELATSVDHCGRCDNRCIDLAMSSARCVDGACGGSCVTPFLDCDGARANGCEVDPRSAPMHCGDCVTICPAGANASAGCAEGRCRLVCAAGFADCDGLAANGCEFDTRGSDANCGACGVRCAPGPHATASCAMGRCDGACDAGYGDCDHDATNGCEVDTQRDATNCGACGVRCGVDASCVRGVCVTCPRGMTSCGERCVDLATNASHCGRCGLSCASGTCDGAICAPRLLRRVSEMEGLVADPRGIYYATRSTRTIRRLSYDGMIDEVVLTGTEQTFALAVDAENLYWSAGPGDPNRIWARPIAGGTPRELCAADCTNVWGLAADAGSLFWGSNPRRAVVRRDLSTGAEVVVESAPAGIWYVAANSRWIVAAASGNLYRAPAAGGALVMFGSLTDAYYHAMAFDGLDRVVIAGASTQGIVRVSVMGGALQTIVPPAPARGRPVGPFKGLSIREGILYFGVADDTRGYGIDSTIEAVELPP